MDNNDNNNRQINTNNYCHFNTNNINYDEITGQKIRFNKLSPSSSSTSSPISSSSSSSSLLSLRYYQLFISEKFADCSFCIDDRIIKAHKLILATSSPVFEAMLYGPLNFNDNINSTGTKIIHISDISPETFYKLLTFIYCGELNFNIENLQNLIELYYCGEKYLINELKQKTLIAIKGKLSFNNILETFDLAIYTNFESLIKICLQFFQQYCLSSDNGATKFMLTIKSSYYHLSKDGIMEILNSLNDKNCKKYLYWFIKEWIRNDFDHQKKQKLNKSAKGNEINDHDDNDQYDFDNVSNDLNAIIQNEQIDWNVIDNIKTDNDYEIGQTIFVERTYYKARQPFLINETNNEFEILIKSNQYISLIGLMINSRLKPNPPNISLNPNNRSQYINMNMNYNNNYNDSHEYQESFKIEIYSIMIDSNGQKQNIIEHSQILNNKMFTYNCDINILLNSKIILIPDEKYIIKFIWDGRAAKGAEYPCSLLSNTAGAILFEDRTTYNTGSILKGLKFLNVEKKN